MMKLLSFTLLNLISVMSKNYFYYFFCFTFLIFNMNKSIIMKLVFFDMYNMFFMIIMVIILSFLMFFLIVQKKFWWNKTYLSMFSILMLFLILFFSFKSFMGMFIFFEMTMILTFFLLLFFSYVEERIMSSMYMMMYTLLGSLPFLFFLIWMNFLENWKFYTQSVVLMNWNLNSLESMMISIMFFIKVPLFFFHQWLPLAHVYASTEISIILAAIILKMGAYGFIRIMTLKFFSMTWSLIMFSISFLGSLFAMGLCIKSNDFKKFLAYMSVGHMNFSIVGGLIFKISSLMCLLYIMLAHSITSFIMFFFSGIISYSLNKREVNLNSLDFMDGKLSKMLILFSILMCMAIPPFILFFAEMGIFFMLTIYSKILLLYFFLMFFLFSFGSFFLFLEMLYKKKKILFSVIIKNMYYFCLYLLMMSLFLFIFSLYMFMLMLLW